MTRRCATCSTGSSNGTYSFSQLTGTRIIGPLELLQVAEVVLPVQPQVRDPVPEHRDAVDPEAEREAGPALGVVADFAEHIWIDDAATAHLDPTGPLADIAATAGAQKTRHVELGGRLREGEEARTHAHLALLAEEHPREVQQRPLQICERDRAVDGEPLDLVKRGRVRRIRRVAPVAAPERDHVHGGLVALHV